MKTHGDPGWGKFPSYLNTFIPLVLDFFDDLNLKVTFFIVGQDAALDKNSDVLKLIIKREHEVGNHSFSHDVWLHNYARDEIEKEVLKAEENIGRVTGQRTVGFRGPGFVYNKMLMEVLAKNKYLYDASILPTFLGPLARIYYFWKSDLSAKEKKQRREIYSSFSEGFRTLKPYYWRLEAGKKLLEIPITTMPFFKTPFHLSYLLYLRCFSTELMFLYLKLALALCKMAKTGLSFLLHPLDFMGNDILPDLNFFPAMNLKTKEKQMIAKKVIKIIQKNFMLIPMKEYSHAFRFNQKYI